MSRGRIFQRDKSLSNTKALTLLELMQKDFSFTEFSEIIQTDPH